LIEEGAGVADDHLIELFLFVGDAVAVDLSSLSDFIFYFLNFVALNLLNLAYFKLFMFVFL